MFKFNKTRIFCTQVNVTVYYEALCGDSKSFISTQLAPNYSAFKKYVNIQFVPYGKAKVGFLLSTFLVPYSLIIMLFWKHFLWIHFERQLQPMTVWNLYASMENRSVLATRLIRVVYIRLQIKRLPLNSFIVQWKVEITTRWWFHSSNFCCIFIGKCVFNPVFFIIGRTVCRKIWFRFEEIPELLYIWIGNTAAIGSCIKNKRIANRFKWIDRICTNHRLQ